MNETEKLVYLNNDAFVVDANQLAEVERNAYKLNPTTGETEKDWIKITEWIEFNGKLIHTVKRISK